MSVYSVILKQSPTYLLIMFIIGCLSLPTPYWNVNSKKKGIFFFSSLMYPQFLDRCLACGRCPILVERMNDIWRVLCLGMVPRLAVHNLISLSQHPLEGGLVTVPLCTEEKNRGF